mgnify:FL=1
MRPGTRSVTPTRTTIPWRWLLPCANRRGWDLDEVRFYTGVSDRDDDPFWHHFWTSKLVHLRRLGGTVYSRSLVYRKQVLRLRDGSEHLSEVAREIREVARHQDRWIKIASAFPVSPVTQNRKGINCTDWIQDRPHDL